MDNSIIYDTLLEKYSSNELNENEFIELVEAVSRKSGNKSSNNSQDIAKARKFVKDVIDMAKERNLNCFVVTDGASGITNNGNEAVRNARKAQEEWERKHGFDPDEDWG
jgi:hypothetical protein